MTATQTCHETAFNEGVAEARIKLGAEVRPIDETMFGLRAVLRAGGQEYSVPDVWNRYHQPFIIGHDRMAPDELIRNIVASVEPYILKGYHERLERESRDRSYIIRHAWDQVRLWDFKRRVLELIRTDIKTHKPDLRKNSKEFKRLAEMVFAEAQVLVLNQMHTALQQQKRSLLAHQDEKQPSTIGQDARKMRDAADYLRSVAADVTILQPDASSVVTELQALADQFDRKAEAMGEPVAQALGEMERVSNMIQQAIVKLAGVNTARRAWAKKLHEIDQGLKGKAKQDALTEVYRLVNEAETIQREVDAMLREENLLTREEAMRCEV